MIRSTHHYCVGCLTNLHDYGQEKCDSCGILLSKDMITSDMGYTIKRKYMKYLLQKRRRKYKIKTRKIVKRDKRRRAKRLLKRRNLNRI